MFSVNVLFLTAAVKVYRQRCLSIGSCCAFGDVIASIAEHGRECEGIKSREGFARNHAQHMDLKSAFVSESGAHDSARGQRIPNPVCSLHS